MNKPALVLIHGWGMNNKIWAPLVELLQDRYDLYLPEIPGLGETTSMPEPYNLTTVAGAIADQVPDNAHWVAWSLGGQIALRAISSGKAVRNLVLVASNPCFVAQDGCEGMSPELYEAFKQGLSTAADKTLTRFLMLQTKGDREAKGLLRPLKGLIEGQSPIGLLESLALLEENTYTDLKNLRQPLLHIYGENDALVPLAVKDAVDECLPNSASVVFNGCGHIPFLHDTQAFAALLEAQVKKAFV